MEIILTVLNFIFFSILIPLFILSFLIFVHELGHYLAARAFKVAIKEFAIGMGPKIFCYRKNKIDYAIRAIPMGGALTMHGEDEESEVENAVSRKPVWQRFIIMASGSFMNLVLGFMIMAIIVSNTPSDRFYSNKINRFGANSISNASGLLEADEILRMNNNRINVFDDIVYVLFREGQDPVDVTVLRNGEKLVIKNVQFLTATAGGVTYGQLDFEPALLSKNFGTVIHATFFRSISTIKLIWTMLFDLLTARVGVEEMAGPVGVIQMVGESAKEATTTEGGNMSFLFLLALITINLGVVNLMPLPALDGGRIVFLIIELVRRKPLNPEHEGYIHLAGFAMLILLIIFVTYQDIMRLVAG